MIINTILRVPEANRKSIRPVTGFRDHKPNRRGFMPYVDKLRLRDEFGAIINSVKPHLLVSA